MDIWQLLNKAAKHEDTYCHQEWRVAETQQHGLTLANVVLSGLLQLHRSINSHQLSRMKRSSSPTAAAAASKSRRSLSVMFLVDYQRQMNEQSGSNVTTQTPDIEEET